MEAPQYDITEVKIHNRMFQIIPITAKCVRREIERKVNQRRKKSIIELYLARLTIS